MLQQAAHSLTILPAKVASYICYGCQRCLAHQMPSNKGHGAPHPYGRQSCGNLYIFGDRQHRFAQSDTKVPHDGTENDSSQHDHAR